MKVDGSSHKGHQDRNMILHRMNPRGIDSRLSPLGHLSAVVHLLGKSCASLHSLKVANWMASIPLFCCELDHGILLTYDANSSILSTCACAQFSSSLHAGKDFAWCASNLIQWIAHSHSTKLTNLICGESPISLLRLAEIVGTSRSTG
jgi:hypothetical protein